MYKMKIYYNNFSILCKLKSKTKNIQNYLIFYALKSFEIFKMNILW